jgi:hypothetical protein
VRISATYNGKRPAIGTGFVVSKDGYILTCNHVVEYAKELMLEIPGLNKPITAKNVASDIKHDVALIKVELDGLNPLPLAKANIVVRGSEVIAIGFPLINQGKTQEKATLIKASISNLNPSYLTLDKAAGIGSSGAPIIDIESSGVIAIASKQQTIIHIKAGRPQSSLSSTFVTPIDFTYPFLKKFVDPTKIVTINPNQLKEFKTQVSNIYLSTSLLVKIDVEIENIKFDIYCESKQSCSMVKLIANCLYQQEPISRQQVEEFYAKLLLAKNAKKAHKGVIISHSDFSKEAKEFGESADIDLFTYKELIRSHFDYELYLNQIISNYDNSELPNTYIDAPGSKGKSETEDSKSVTELVDSSFDIGISNIALLADFGMGKTTFCDKYAYDLAKEFLDEPMLNFLPIRVDLREYKSSLQIEELIIRTLNKKYGLTITLQGFTFLQRLGFLMFILDGFDEMADRVDTATVNQNLRELMSLTSVGGTKNRLIITSRTHFFKNRVDETKLNEFQIIHLKPWNKEQIKNYLTKRFGGKSLYFLQKIEKIFNLNELSKTPIFLDMIVQSLPELKKTNNNVTSAKLYEVYTNKLIKSQEKRRGSILSQEEKAELMEMIAYCMLEQDELRVHYQALNDLLEDKSQLQDIQAFSNDIRTCTFLIRDGDYYTFSHSSFMEFFVARKYLKEIQSRYIKDFGKVYFKEEIFLFLIEMIQETDLLETLHYLAKYCDVARARIHVMIVLGRLKKTESINILYDILEHDTYSRVSGHAAEILYSCFNEKDAFSILIKSLSIQPYTRNLNIPQEPNIGWYLDSKRSFKLDDKSTIIFFLDVLRKRLYSDPNLRWYALSILSRITTLSVIVTQNDIEIITDILLQDNLPRARAYAATILGNLGKSQRIILNALEKCSKNDIDPSVRRVCAQSIRNIKLRDQATASPLNKVDK